MPPHNQNRMDFYLKLEAAHSSLGRAAARGDEVAARTAVVEGADVNAAVYHGDGTMGGTRTAAFLAAKRGHLGVLAVLLAAPVSADPNKRDTITGFTPLHMACINNHPDAVTLLLAHGADPNLADKDGITPCMIAAYKGHTACLRALAEGDGQQDKALDVNVVSTGGPQKGKTALDLALEKNRAAVDAGNTQRSRAVLEAAAYLRELGALRAADLPPPRKPPKSATKTGKRPQPPGGGAALEGGARRRAAWLQLWRQYHLLR